MGPAVEAGRSNGKTGRSGQRGAHRLFGVFDAVGEPDDGAFPEPSEARAYAEPPPEIRPGPKRADHATASVCEPNRELIWTVLAKSSNGMGIWQDLVDGHGFTGGYDSVKGIAAKLRPMHHRKHA
jgi:hypothetical protein